MTEKYTPEKVAELVETANTMRAQLGEHYPKTGSILDLWLRTADALTAVSADRDRLHKAITEALAFESVLPAIATEPRRILRAALDKEGDDDE